MNVDNAQFALDEQPSIVRLQRGAHAILNNRLYLGSAKSAINEAVLKADGITHILNVTKELQKQHYSGITVCQLPCYDSPQQQLPFEEAAAFIDQCLSNNNNTEQEAGGGGGRCLVHCNAGQSRSASVVIYYLMTKEKSLKQSYEYVKARKPDIRPNYGFCSQLQCAELKLFKERKTSSLDMTEYKADTLCEILEGSGKTKEDVLDALRVTRGDGEIALGMLLEE